MAYIFRKHQLAASTALILPPSEWEAAVEELQQLIHPADFWRSEDAKTLSMAELRQLIAFAAQTPVGSGKIACILFADSLRAEVANALLKLLEEPPAYLTVVLLAETDRFLPTVRSRLWVIDLESVPQAADEKSDTALWQELLEEEAQALPESAEELQELLYLTPLLHTTIQQPLVREGFARHNRK